MGNNLEKPNYTWQLRRHPKVGFGSDQEDEKWTLTFPRIWGVMSDSCVRIGHCRVCRGAQPRGPASESSRLCTCSGVLRTNRTFPGSRSTLPVPRLSCRALYGAEPPSLGSQYHTHNYSDIHYDRDPSAGHLTFTERKSMTVYVNYIIKWKGI